MQVKKVGKALDAVIWLLVAAGIGILAYVYDRLPSEVPFHYDNSGKVNGMEPKYALWISEAFFVLIIFGLSWWQQYVLSLSRSEETLEETKSVYKPVFFLSVIKLVITVTVSMTHWTSIVSMEVLPWWFFPTILLFTLAAVGWGIWFLSKN